MSLIKKPQVNVTAVTVVRLIFEDTTHSSHRAQMGTDFRKVSGITAEVWRLRQGIVEQSQPVMLSRCLAR